MINKYYAINNRDFYICDLFTKKFTYKYSKYLKYNLYNIIYNNIDNYPNICNKIEVILPLYEYFNKITSDIINIEYPDKTYNNLIILKKFRSTSENILLNQILDYSVMEVYDYIFRYCSENIIYYLINNVKEL
jgi:hypothetical protein